MSGKEIRVPDLGDFDAVDVIEVHVAPGDRISKDDPQPTFYFLHALVSHQPHHLLPSGQENLTWHRVPGRSPSR